MKLDIEGRIKNMRLPSGRAAIFYSIFEAISNGIHAIEERWGLEAAKNKGEIRVNILRGAEKKIVGVDIIDNGIGLYKSHLTSFETCDTREKAGIGGRGVGRLVWFKVFDTVEVESSFRDAGDLELTKINFKFDPYNEESIVGLSASPSGDQSYTRVQLRDAQAQYALNLSLALIARNICHHFFAYYIAGKMPKISVHEGRRSIDILQYLSARTDLKDTEVIDLQAQGLGTLTINHVYVDPKVARELSNSILLTAQGRVVQSIEIEKKFALRSLASGKSYACLVSGKFLDDNVDQERTSFKVQEAELDEIKESALLAAEGFLGEHIKIVRGVQASVTIGILQEHPQLAVAVDNVDEFVKGLSPSMSDEEIGKTLFTHLYRREKKIRSDIDGLEGEEIVLDKEVSFKVTSLIDKVHADAQRRLAEYTVKRHQIIQIARSLLRFTDEETRRYALEKAVHELICPMGRMLGAKNYDDHNLWLIDDLLSYYHFFASDKTLKSMGVDESTKEPDLLFMNPFGFRREGTNDPVVIIEFKRPGDEALSSDPVDQVLGYIEKLQSKTVRDTEGEVVSEISRDTPFECVVVCDLTEGARKRLERSVAQHPTPDKMGYYGYSGRHNASIRVISYQKVFRDAEIRNASFFRHLGLMPEEVKQSILRSSGIASHTIRNIDESKATPH